MLTIMPSMTAFILKLLIINLPLNNYTIIIILIIIGSLNLFF